MNDAKENPTGFVAYLSYVRDLWGVSNKVSRSIAKFLADDTERKNQIQPTILLSLDDSGCCG